MIGKELRKTIWTLQERGKRKKEIARLLHLDPKTVRKILKEDQSDERKIRDDKKDPGVDLLQKVHKSACGYVQRMYEILTEEYHVTIGYSTLTRLLRQHGIGENKNIRCAHTGDFPGEEMQHDTSVYNIFIAGKKTRVIASAIYYRYSKIRYLKFYIRFNRFVMKCFLHEALLFWKYSCKKCVIDNTNLAVLYGTGSAAVFHPEMILFARTYGFEWLAHEKGHANRKAGKERNFWTIETNFFPGRTFNSLEDMNGQAYAWATDRYALRPLSKTRLIPLRLFEDEKPFLFEIPEIIFPPTRPDRRTVDQYGYISFDGNFYWVPGISRGDADIIEYPNKIQICTKDHSLVEYQLPAWNIKNKKFCPDGVAQSPYKPKHMERDYHEEESLLRKMDAVISSYIDFIKSKECAIKQKPRYICLLYGLSKKVSGSLFIKGIERALNFRVTSIERIERILMLLMQGSLYLPPEMPCANDFENTEAYRQGEFSIESGIPELPAESEENSGYSTPEGEEKNGQDD